MSADAAMTVVSRARALRCRLLGAALSLFAAAAARGAETPLFAAPSPTHAAETNGASSIGHVGLALAVVLVVVFAAAWALKFMRGLNVGGGTQQLRVVSQVALGPKERAVIVRVADVNVLVGVAPGQVTALHMWAASDNDSQASNAPVPQSTSTSLPPTFKALLKKSLGLNPGSSNSSGAS